MKAQPISEDRLVGGGRYKDPMQTNDLCNVTQSYINAARRLIVPDRRASANGNQ
jgi:hypothetical protein